MDESRDMEDPENLKDDSRQHGGPNQRTEETAGQKARGPVIRVREMEVDDIPKVFHLGEHLFEAERAPNMYRTWDEYEVIQLYHGDTDFCLVVEADGELVGFALGTTITKAHSAWKYGHLVWLGVAPEFQRLGAAERLFRHFKERMLKDNVRMLLVDTEAENLPALHLFRKLGFRNPQQHIYLSMNLAAEMQRLKRKNGDAPGAPRGGGND
jgi:ribosomal protein S18 acetylase RimI-like enzyme